MDDDEPAKMSLTNLRTARTLEAQFNPTEIGARLAVAFEDLAILGHSHQPQQFKFVGNLEIPVDLFFDRLTSNGGGGGGQNFDLARNFLWSLAYPPSDASVLSAGTPDVLFVWPNLYSLVCRVRELEERFPRMAKDGRGTLMTFRLKLHRFTQFRLFAQDIERHGFQEPR